MKYCNLWKIIPDEEKERVFSESYTASAELDPSFLAFESVYRSLQDTISDKENTTIVDLGCAYNPQIYYLSEFKKVYSVDLPMKLCCPKANEVRFTLPNNEIHITSIQDWIKNVLPTLNLDLLKTFAVCSYVPDTEAQKLVTETFPNHLVVYCKDIKSNKSPDFPDFVFKDYDKEDIKEMEDLDRC